MFGNGNNQAMQFMMQGYSDSIKTYDDQSAGNLMKNINGLANSYFSNESSIQNTEAQRLSNHFNRENMTTALKQQEEKLREQELANNFQEDTYKDRVRNVTYLTNMNQDAATLSRETLGYDYKTGKVKEGFNGRIQSNLVDNKKNIKTADSYIDMTNAENYAATSLANLNKTKTDLTRQNYNGIPDYVINGKHYESVIDDGKGGKIGVNEYTPEQLKIVQDHNNQIERNKQMHRAVDTSSNQAAVEGNMALEAQSRVAANAANIQNRQQIELNELMQKTSTSDLQLQQNYIAALQNGSNVVQLADGSAIPLETAQARLFAQGIFQPNGYSNVNMTLGGNLGLTHKQTHLEQAIQTQIELDSINQSLEKLSPEERAKIINDPKFRKDTLEAFGRLPTSTQNRFNDGVASLRKTKTLIDNVNGLLNNSNRVNFVLGKITQYMPSDLNNAGISTDEALKNVIKTQSLLTRTDLMKGSLSNKDMDILKTGDFDFFRNDEYNGVILLALQQEQLNKYRNIIMSLGNSPEALAVKAPDLYEDYINTKKFVELGDIYYNHRKDLEPFLQQRNAEIARRKQNQQR